MKPMDNSATSIEADAPSDARISALIALLADEDPQVGDTILGHLREAGDAALSGLELALDNPNPTLSERARALLGEMRRNTVVEDIRQFATSGAVNLEQGLLLLSRLHDPNLDTEACSTRLSHMAEDLMIRLDPGDGVDAMLNTWSRYLFDEQGLAGNSDDYYNQGNSYLHTMLETRRGIPISLSALYIILAQRLGLPIHGIGMPGHFLVKFDDGHEVRVIDPFHKGRVLDRDGCSRLLRGLGLSFDERYLEPVSTHYILERTLKNLIGVYAEGDQPTLLALHQRALDALNSGA
jgi:regulator of sirC expression with transglutaminase-like and TPR domain